MSEIKRYRVNANGDGVTPEYEGHLVLYSDHLQAIAIITSERDAAVKERDEARAGYELTHKVLCERFGLKCLPMQAAGFAAQEYDTARAALAEAERERIKLDLKLRQAEADLLAPADWRRKIPLFLKEWDDLRADRDRLSAELEEARKALRRWMEGESLVEQDRIAASSAAYDSAIELTKAVLAYPAPGNPTKEPTE